MTTSVRLPSGIPDARPASLNAVRGFEDKQLLRLATVEGDRQHAVFNGIDQNRQIEISSKPAFYAIVFTRMRIIKRIDVPSIFRDLSNRVPGRRDVVGELARVARRGNGKRDRRRRSRAKDHPMVCD